MPIDEYREYRRQVAAGYWKPSAPAADEDMPSFAKAALDEAVAAKGPRLDNAAIINEALKRVQDNTINPPGLDVNASYGKMNWEREPTATEKGNAATYDKGAMERARMAYERERHLINSRGERSDTESKDQANQLAYMRLKQEMATIEDKQIEADRLKRFWVWCDKNGMDYYSECPPNWVELTRGGEWRDLNAEPLFDSGEDDDFEDDNEPEKEPEPMAKNFSTLIFLYDDAVRAIKATYLADDDPTIKAKGLTKAPETMFKTYDTTLKVNDIVVVPSDTRHKMATVKVSAINVQDEIDFDDQKKVDWVVGKVFADEYESNKARDEKAAEAMRHAEKIKRREELKADLEKAGIGAAVSSTYLPASPQPAPVRPPQTAPDPMDLGGAYDPAKDGPKF